MSAKLRIDYLKLKMMDNLIVPSQGQRYAPCADFIDYRPLCAELLGYSFKKIRGICRRETPVGGGKSFFNYVITPTAATPCFYTSGNQMVCGQVPGLFIGQDSHLTIHVFD